MSSWLERKRQPPPPPPPPTLFEVAKKPKPPQKSTKKTKIVFFSLHFTQFSLFFCSSFFLTPQILLHVSIAPPQRSPKPKWAKAPWDDRNQHLTMSSCGRLLFFSPLFLARLFQRKRTQMLWFGAGVVFGLTFGEIPVAYKGV